MTGIFEIIKSIFKFIQGLGTLFLGIIVLILIAAVAMVPRGQVAPSIPDGALMVLRPQGTIVEQARIPDPLESAFGGFKNTPVETSVHDVLTSIKRAKTDSRIAGIVLLTDSMMGAAPSHLHDMANALKSFRDSGKPLYAVSSGYSQGDYLLASQANKVFINSAGSVMLTGYGSYVTYFKQLLDKIGAEVNVFRVGTYKSAVEPYLRDDMSPAAKQANQEFLGNLWSQYLEMIAAGRETEAQTIKDSIENTNELLRTAGGSFAQLALDTNLVDEVTSRSGWRRQLMNDHGETDDGVSFTQIHFQDYLATTNSSRKGRGSAIAVITAQGEIVMGEGPANVAAAETLVRHIRSARNNSNTGAIVLRVDSPGGSVFASELIRQELLTAQDDGIPVVASFGPYAASGGYWISANADEIWASPATITGSIGIFGVVPTFQNTLDKVGIHTDGVGTTKLSGSFDVTRSLSPDTKDLIQQSIESGYGQFLKLVSEGRGMSVEDVDKIAQGRVWDGQTAKELGLVDQLGTLEDAISAAARKADLKSFHPRFYKDGPTQFERILLDIMNSKVANGYDIDRLSPMSPFMKAALKVKADVEFLTRFNDPLGQYSLCLNCGVR